MIAVVRIENEEDWIKAQQIRKQVFVEEQGVPEKDEYDEYDAVARHFLAADTMSGEAFGTARWRTTTKGVKLERFAVVAKARGRGIGAMLLESVLGDIKQEMPGEAVDLYLHAQLAAVPFYQNFGFQK